MLMMKKIRKRRRHARSTRDGREAGRMWDLPLAGGRSSAVDVRDNINASHMYMSTASGIIRPSHFGIVSSEKSE